MVLSCNRVRVNFVFSLYPNQTAKRRLSTKSSILTVLSSELSDMLMRMVMRMLMTIILMAHYVMLSSARYFPDPGLFCPDRWTRGKLSVSSEEVLHNWMSHLHGCEVYSISPQYGIFGIYLRLMVHHDS
jgi:hypothetical protein